MKIGERLFILLFMIFSIIILTQSKALPSGANFGIGPGFLPKYVSILSIILCVILLVMNFIKEKDSTKEFGNKEGLIRMALTFGLLLVSVFLMNYIGMIIPLILFLIIEFKFIEKYKLLTSIKVSVFSIAIFYAIFKIWLGVPIELI